MQVQTGTLTPNPRKITRRGGGSKWIEHLADELGANRITNEEFIAQRKAGPPQQGNAVQGAEGSAATNGAERAQPTAADGQPPQGGKMTLHDIEQNIRIKKTACKRF